jgi:YD repeat-containing protein
MDRLVRAKNEDGAITKYTRDAKGRATKIEDALGLSSIHNRRRTRCLTNSKKSRGEGFPNLLKKETPIVPRYALSSDITYLRTAEGFDYLCTVKDIVTGEILGRHSSDRMTKELVINAFLSAHARYHFKEGCLFHSDYAEPVYIESLYGDP